MLRVSSLLQVCQTEQQRWLFCLHLLLGFDNLSVSCFTCCVIGSLCLAFLIPSACTGQLHAISGIQGHLPERDRLKILVLQVSLDNHHKGWCLHSADGIKRLSHDAAGLCRIHANQPVCFTSRLSSNKKVVVVAIGLEVIKSILDSGIGQTVNPQTHDRLPNIEIVHNITQDSFTLPGTIGCSNNGICILEELLDDSELLHHSWIILIGLTFLLLSGNHQKLLGQHGKVAFRPTVIAIVLRQGQLYQMTKGICHLPAITLVEAILFLGGSYDSGNALRNAGFLC